MSNARKLVVLGGRAYTVEANTFFAAMDAQLAANDKAAIDTFFRSQQSKGILAETEIGYIHCLDTSLQARLNYKTPGSFTLQEVNSPTFATRQGYTGNGSSARLNTAWATATNSAVISQDNVGLWVWSRTDGQDSGQVGAAVASGLSLCPRTTSDTMIGRANDNTNTARANTTGMGLFGVTRSAAGTKKYWLNGVQVGADVSVTSTGLSSSVLWFLAANSSSFSTRQFSFGAVTTALAGKELSFYNDVLALMQNFGAA